MASFSVVTNIAALNATANLYSTQLGLNKALTRVSSGLRINSSADDAAGLAVANGFRSKVAILTQGVRNANDALSDLQIKDSALDNISKLLDRLAVLATQAATSSTTDTQRTTLDQEFQDVVDEIARESNVAGFAVASTYSVYVSNDGPDGIVTGNVGAVTETSLGLGALSVASEAGAQAAVTAVTAAIATLGGVQGEIGTVANRLSYAIALGQSQIVSNKAAESRIRDANLAEESANLTRFSILNQSGIAALAQANQSTAVVLALLK